MSELMGWTFHKIEDKPQTLADVPDGWEGLATEGDYSLVTLMRVENGIVYLIFGDGTKRPARLGKLAYRVYNPDPVKMRIKDLPDGGCFRYQDVSSGYMWVFDRNGQKWFNVVHEDGATDSDILPEKCVNEFVVLLPRVAKWGPI